MRSGRSSWRRQHRLPMSDLHPFANPGRTKLALVSRGVALPDGFAQPSKYVSQTNAVEAVVDIRLPSGQFASVPIAQPYTARSPFALREKADNTYLLECGGEEQVVELVKAPSFYRRTTRSGARMGSFASLHDKLLMLHPSMGCGFFAREDTACRYCQYDSVLNEEEPPLRDPLELVEVVRAALEERDIDTVYLYNGYAPGDDAGLGRLVPLIALLRRHLGHRQIALETVAPLDLSVVDELYASGLDIFVCNLEVHDAQAFSDICPGKAEHGGQAAIWEALSHARQVFRSGAVVSHLIVGLEPLTSTVAGMEALVSHKIVPLLVPFRPLPGTPLGERPLPSLDDVEQALLEQYRLLEASGLPTHRLRDMGRVMTPMETRVLVGKSVSLRERARRWEVSGAGRRLAGWMDKLHRTLRVQHVDTPSDK